MIKVDPLGADTVRVRWLTVAAEDAVHLSRWRGMLDAQERARADRYLFDADRDAFIAAHALLRAMLSEATGQPTATWRYIEGVRGKPALARECIGAEVHFNISHKRGFVACAVAGDEVGVDVEASDRPVSFDIADRYFAPEEARLVKSASPERRADVFFRLWTLKEAFIKATGEGLTRPLDSFSFALDPVRIAFRGGEDDPAAWHFAERHAAVARPLAIAVRRSGRPPFRLDARAARFEDVAPS